MAISAPFTVTSTGTAGWQAIADKLFSRPAVLVEIDWSSGTRRYSIDYVRPVHCYKGNIISLPDISSSAGTIARTFSRSSINIIFSDTDYEFRTLEDTENPGLKNIEVRAYIAFEEDSFSNKYLVYTGNISEWKRLANLQFSITAEQVAYNLNNTYPDKLVEITDYPNAHETALGLPIPVPYGTISAEGLSDNGAFGWPLQLTTGLGFVDTTIGSEKHLVALQTAAAGLSVDRVYINDVLKVEGVDDDYSVSTQVIDGKTHTEIHWNSHDLVLNGGFAANTDNWTAVNSATLASVAGGKTGNCLQITENGDDEPGAYQDITAVPETYYKFTCYMDAGTEDEYKVLIYDQTNDSIINDSGWLTESAGDWSTSRDIEFTTPIGCSTIRIYVYSRSQNGEEKTFKFDSIVSYIIPVTENDLVTCDISLADSRGPVETLYHYMTNFCDYAAANYNTSSYNDAVTLEGSRLYKFDGVIGKREKLSTILDNWRNEFELDIFWGVDGKIAFKYMSAVIDAGVSRYNDLVHVLPEFQSTPQALKIINLYRYSYNYNYARGFYSNYDEISDSDSQTKYGEIFKDSVVFKWIRNEAMAEDIISRKLLRLKDPITFNRVLVSLFGFSKGLTDVFKLTHLEGVGASGYTDRVLQIRTINLDLNNYIAEFTAEDTTTFMGSFCRLGDRSTLGADWLVASKADKEYLYLCDEETGEFSNGDPGKQLFD